MSQRTWLDIGRANVEKRKTYHRAFRDTFGIDLAHFMDNFTGFDIVAFDEHLKVPEDVCVSTFILEHYGQPAVDIIKGLLDIKDEPNNERPTTQAV